MKQNSNRDVFGSVVQRAIILSYKEDVSQLTKALREEGIVAEVQKIDYVEDELLYTSSNRTFINHMMAWKAIVNSSGYTLICESDFVPCVGLAEFPVFWPIDDNMAWGYLYQGSPRLLYLTRKWPYFLRGHCAPLVAYVIGPAVAEALVEFYEYEKRQYDFKQYFAFDAHLQWYAMGKGACAFIPWRHYGEHGGFPNPEHGSLGKLASGGRHHADNLMGPLHFLPQYAKGSTLIYCGVRALWRLKGLTRLLTGRWIIMTSMYKCKIGDRIIMIAVGLLRLCPRVRNRRSYKCNAG